MAEPAVVVLEPQPTPCRVLLEGEGAYTISVPVRAWRVTARDDDDGFGGVSVVALIAPEGDGALITSSEATGLYAVVGEEYPWDAELDAGFDLEAVANAHGIDSPEWTRTWSAHCREAQRLELRHLSEVCGFRPGQTEEAAP